MGRKGLAREEEKGTTNGVLVAVKARIIKSTIGIADTQCQGWFRSFS